MNNPALKTHEKIDKSIILIVDKKGEIGEPLGEAMSKDFLVVLVSKRSIGETKNLIHIPFLKKFPQIPDNKYSLIYLIDDGSKETRESAESLISKARESESPFFFVGNIRYSEDEILDNQVAFYSKAKGLITGDVFGDSIDPAESTIQRYIFESRKYGRIYVEGDGLGLNLPVSLGDTVELIIKATYLEFSEKIVLLFGPQLITDLSLAHLFQKADPDISVDFKKGTGHKNIFIHKKALHVIPSYNLLAKIKELSLDEKDIKLRTSRGIRKPSKLFRLVLISIIFILLLPFLSTAIYAGLGLSQLSSARGSLEKGNIEQAVGKANNSKTFFEIASKTSKTLEFEAGLFGQKKKAESLTRKIDSGKNLSVAIGLGLEGLQGLQAIYSGKSKVPKDDFAKSSYALQSSISLIQKTKLETGLPKELEATFSDLEPLIDLTVNISDILPGLLGFNGEKTYLVLFQNNMELRPGGGFIGSYGLLTLENAKVKDFEVKDVYETDGQLKEHVEPPFPIRRYLPSAHWYLRDSNFHPDFVKSAISSASIYSLETKKQVDGVIGINLNFARNLLEAMGEIDVNDYKVSINKDNLYEETQKRSQDNFFPGSTQKKDFLSSLAKSMEETLNSKGDQSFLGLAQALGKSIKEKDVNFAFQESEYQDVFTANGWSSSLWDQRTIEEGRIVDYLGIVEANLGVNKANYYVSRSVSKNVTIEKDGGVKSKITIVYKNGSPQGSKLGGDYKNYLQLVLPQGAIIDGISVDGRKQTIQGAITDFYIYETKNFKPPSGLEVDQKEELGKKIAGFLLNIPRGKLQAIEIDINLPYKLDIKDPDLYYSLKVFKQPGINYPFDLNISMPDNLKIIEAPEVKEVRKDEEINILIGQK